MDREKVIKAFELCESGSGQRCCETDCPYYYRECTEDLKNDILALLKEQDEQKLRWLRNIADNQLANAPTETMDETSHTYYDGLWHGLQMAYEILTEERRKGLL